MTTTPHNYRGFETYHKDLGEYTWDQAVKSVESLGDDWRLPTKEELNVIYQRKEVIGGFECISYWSSTDELDFAWALYFSNGYQYHFPKDLHFAVRPVRDVSKPSNKPLELPERMSLDEIPLFFKYIDD